MKICFQKYSLLSHFLRILITFNNSARGHQNKKILDKIEVFYFWGQLLGAFWEIFLFLKNKNDDLFCLIVLISCKNRNNFLKSILEFNHFPVPSENHD